MRRWWHTCVVVVLVDVDSGVYTKAAHTVRGSLCGGMLRSLKIITDHTASVSVPWPTTLGEYSYLVYPYVHWRRRHWNWIIPPLSISGLVHTLRCWGRGERKREKGGASIGAGLQVRETRVKKGTTVSRALYLGQLGPIPPMPPSVPKEKNIGGESGRPGCRARVGGACNCASLESVPS